MTLFLKRGNTFRVSTKEQLDLQELLPANNYVIKEDDYGSLYLEQIDKFELPSKLYGKTIEQTYRILNTFNKRTTSTGVLLVGEKGCGKTLLAKNISVNGALLDIPTILVNTPFKGDKFNTFVQQIDQPIILFFDEFEKVYHDDEDQQAILTLMDGIFNSKKLFILTSNDKYKINTQMRNRPGRLYYLIEYKGVESEFVNEYCSDWLSNKNRIEGVMQFASTFNDFNFDMLKALVEEMNLYDEPAHIAASMLNIKQEFEQDVSYTIKKIIIKGSEKQPAQSEINCNPLMSRYFYIDYLDSDESGNKHGNIHTFFNSNLKEIVDNGRKFLFSNGNDNENILILEKKEQLPVNFNAIWSNIL